MMPGITGSVLRHEKREDEGYDIYVNGQRRTFRDVEATAYDAARQLKLYSKYQDKVEVVVRATDERIDVDGRTRSASSMIPGT